MTCSSCSHQNRPGARFCGGCGGALQRACAECGRELSPDLRFCDQCGTPAPGAAPAPRPADPAGARKVVTLLFADLAGSTALHERLDPESAQRFMKRYYDLARGAIESQGGTLAKLLGDGVMAVFGIPRVAEDDAIRALRAAVAMQEAFHALAEQQRGLVGETGLRVAVNTGEVVIKGEDEILGDPVNVAARLQERGRNGDVVLGESTRRLVASQVTLEFLGAFDLKGRAEAVKSYRVVSLEAPGRAATPFVGREEELARITTVFDGAVTTPAARLAVLMGSPGLGKSRLITEFSRRSGEAATIIQAHCDAAGGATFAPLGEALRDFLGIETGTSTDGVRAAVEGALSRQGNREASGPADAATSDERSRIAAGIAGVIVGSPGAPEETFFVVRRFLATLATGGPVVLVIDDLQWAEPLLLDLVEHLIQWGRGLPLLVLVGARPELREVRSSFATPGALVADVVMLAGLDAGVAMRLAAGVIGATDLPAAVAARVLASSEGNPLFIGELVRMLVDEGALVRQGDRWSTGEALATVEMPPTIHALLAARIERLDPHHCMVLERAAVVGRQFSRSAVAALLPEGGAGGGATEAAAIRSELDTTLESLQRAQLLEPDTGWMLGEPVLRFHHMLVRDAAYRRLLKGTRAELHQRLADWIEDRAGQAPEHDETIGRHLEEAHRLLGELGPMDAAGRLLGNRASTRLASAGRRALVGDDVPLAATLLGRALRCLAADDALRADLAVDWCEALLAAGDVATATTAIDDLARDIERLPSNPAAAENTPDARSAARLRAWHTCFVGELTVLTAPEELSATVDLVAEAATALAALADSAGEAKAHFVHALALARLGRIGACEACLDQALAAARQAGDRRRANTVLAIAPVAALWGPSPVTRASGRCLDVVRVLRITQGAPAVEAVALSCQGVLEALRGRTDAAHRMIATARAMVEELGIAHRVFEVDVSAGFVAMLEDDAAKATQILRGAYDGFRDLGLGIDAARAAALLGQALLAEDHIEQAEALSHESESLAGDDLKAAIAWRAVRAEALARRGEHAAAVALAQAGVEIAAATDALLDHADARVALAAALGAAGRRAEAETEHRRAVQLWEAKGATLLAERARSEASAASPEVAEPASPATQGPRRRALRENFAIEQLRRSEAAVDARDVQALADVYRRDVEIVDHQHGIDYGYDGIFDRVRDWAEDSSDVLFHHEALAVLGDYVALCRLRATASASVLYGATLGATESNYLLVIEADDQGCARRIDIFGEGALRDVVVRCYERYAAGLPEGEERRRAEATAQSMEILRSANAEPELVVTALAADFEAVDHRRLGSWSAKGAVAYLDHLRALRKVADAVDLQWKEVLALTANALLVRVLHCGNERVGEGAYERAFLSLWVLGTDGRFARAEWFDEECEAEAMARFEGFAADLLVVAPPRRRVRPNAASRMLRGIEAGFAALDRDAIESLLADPLHTVEHPTGATYEREGQLESIDRMLRLPNLDFRLEVLATLGESHCLGRRRVAASGTGGGRFDVAEFEMDHIVLSEVDAEGRLRVTEVFAADALSDAVVRLYELYAENLPEGSERTRAAGIAHALSVLEGPVDPDRLAEAYAPDIRLADHRVLGTWSSESRDDLMTHFRHQLELVQGFAVRKEEVLALEPDRLLVHLTYYGVGRDSGGPFENRICVIYRFGDDGRVAQIECWEPEREADALAHFDALAATTPEGRSTRGQAQRRIRANRASATWERHMAAVDSRDLAALEATFSADLVYVHHGTGVTLSKREMSATWRSAFQAERLITESQVLGTLGESHVLARNHVEVEGLTEAGFRDFGPSEIDTLTVAEDRGAGFERLDSFACHQLGDALVRFYELYAESLPEGPERTRAAGIARLLSTLNGPIDPEAAVAVLDPATCNVDHRVLGTWSTSSGAETLRHYREQLDLAPDFSARSEAVLALGPAAMLLRMTFFGTGRESGGAFENPILQLWTFGTNGLACHNETFEADQEEEARARFDAIAAGASPEPAPGEDLFANRATRVLNRFFAANARKDWEGLSGLCASGLQFDDRRPLLRLELSREGFLGQYRTLFDSPNGRWTNTVLATRGECMALALLFFQADVDESGGALEIDHLAVLKVDRQDDGSDCYVAIVLFEPEDIAAAYDELEARFLAGEAAKFPLVGGGLESSRFFRDRDWEAFAQGYAPGFLYRDHRRLGVGDMLDGREALVELLQATVKLAPDAHYRDDHVRLSARGILRQTALVGTRDGGVFENPMLGVFEANGQGRIARLDTFDVEDFDGALARFHELSAPASSPCATNLATRSAATTAETWQAKDWSRFEARFSPGARLSDRRGAVQLELDREQMIAFTRSLGEFEEVRIHTETLATRGERLALLHSRIEVAGNDVGPSEIDHLNLYETDEDGELLQIVRWGVDDLAAAYAELDARYEAHLGNRVPGSWSLLRRWTRAVAERDWEAVVSLCSDGFVEHDHRGLALLGVTEGAQAWVPVLKAVSDLAPDSVFRHHHFVPGPRGYYAEGAFCGTREGGPFEIVINALVEIDDRGALARVDLYDDDRVFASPRWVELGMPATMASHSSAAAKSPPPITVEPNLALKSLTAWTEDYGRAFETEGWDELRRSCHPDMVFEDRRRLALLDGGVDLMVAAARERGAIGARPSWIPVAVFGERVAAVKMLWSGGPPDGRFEIEYLCVTECDQDSLVTAFVLFDTDDSRRMQDDALSRWTQLKPDVVTEVTAPAWQVVDAFNEKDSAKWRATFADDLVVEDHRRTGMGRLDGVDAYTRSVEALWALAPDTKVEEGWGWPVFDRHGAISVIDRTGMMPHRGGGFENEYLLLYLVAQGRITRVELFEMDALDLALARFEELRSRG
jgi:class 3 adenylate cyclase/ketosteroid isomerase-like protein/tetratricopeptide (TPR) repeat protein